MKLWFAVQVMIVGMLIVFTGLVILIGAIKLLSAIIAVATANKAKPAPAPVAAAAKAPVPVGTGAVPAPDAQDLSLIALLTATILASEGSKDGKRMVVRSIRRVG